jgi:serine protease Do
MSISAVLLAGFLFASADAPQAPSKTPEPDALRTLSRSVRSLAQRVSPAVVQIHVSGYGPLEEEEGRAASIIAPQRSLGSGVIVDRGGYIVTNAHVVRGAVKVRVLLASTAKGGAGVPLEARIVGIDRESDLALIKVGQEGLPTLRFGNSDALRQGDVVLAIGSPLGLRNSVSMGIVSASARAVNEESPMVYVQTDASINPGNSGGALVNVDGALMGINTFILSQSGGSEGIGFAIPSNTVRNVYTQLKRKGHVHRGTVGIAAQTITPVLAEGLGLARQSGVIAADVEPDGPAERAGVKRGDILLSMDGRGLDSARQLESGVYRRQKGEKAALKVLRAQDEMDVSVGVEELENQDDPLAGLVTPEKNLIPRLGVLCIEIDKRVAAMMHGLRQQYGLIVAAKSPEGQGRYIELRPGDVIHAVNTLPVSTVDALRESIDAMKRGAAVVLQVERSGVFRYVAFEIE